MLEPLFEFKSLQDMVDKFPNDEACIVYLEKIRWGGAEFVRSPYDHKSKVYASNKNKHQYKCKNTGKYFNVKTNTFLENTKIPIRSWFIAIYLLISDKKGRSSHQLARDLGVTQKTAWFMLQRLRYVLTHPIFTKQLENKAILDETYVGGKQKFRHKDKKELYKSSYDKKHGREQIKDKKCVAGAIDPNGYIVLKYIPNSSKEHLIPFIYETVKTGTLLITDEHSAYRAVEKDYPHEFVKHVLKQYMNDNGYTTNYIENVWAHLKRSLYGIYHIVSRKHIQAYLDEFSFRYNTKHIGGGERFIYYLSCMNRRITYKELTRKQAA